ncbi:tetratricopeptide repeat protein [candidate division KSB1 bacterium]|nr:tetratricopeptide repeat protein [candidate division KSB1 bacterium]
MKNEIKILFFVLPFFLHIHILYSQGSDDSGFADFLFKKGEYYRAITEYYRVFHFCTDSSKKVSLLCNIGLCYFRGEDYEGYISFFKNNENYFSSHPEQRARMDLYLGKSYYSLNRYQEAISILEGSITRANDYFYNERQFLLGISYARIFAWQKAIQKMELIQPQLEPHIQTVNLCRSLQNFPDLPQKSRFWAGSFSTVIPGAGYFYCNRKQTGLTSLIVNGLIFCAVRDAVRQKQYGIACAAGFLGFGWYIGNIRGSIDAADVYNTNTRNAFIDYILKRNNMNEYLSSE